MNPLIELDVQLRTIFEEYPELQEAFEKAIEQFSPGVVVHVIDWAAFMRRFERRLGGEQRE